MQLNKIEGKFFSDVLQAEPEVPVRAKLKVYDDEFPVMVIPQISQDGYFEIHYFGTPAHLPKDDNGTRTWKDVEIFGVHPILEKAWSKRDIVRLKFEKRPHPFVLLDNAEGPDISARVLVVEQKHRGRLAISDNQIQLEKKSLRRAEFSLVDFPKIVYSGSEWLRKLLAKGQEEFDAFRSDLQSAVDRVDDDDFSIHTKYQNKTNLYTGDGWEVTLTEDDEQTRGSSSYTGTIQREDGDEFEAQDLLHLLEGLVKFFSFTSCAYRYPTAVIGYDSNDMVVWGQIGKFELMRRSHNWFDNSGTISANVYLEHFFPKFWSTWGAKQDEITAAIECYVNSRAMQQEGFPQSAVATVYAGLDLLAHLIIDKPKRNNPKYNIKTALQQYNIPHQCLDRSKNPISFQTSKNLQVAPTGVELLSSVRNYVVHPIDSYKLIIKQELLQHLDNDYHPYFYVHDLGHFYLEYLLLEMCGYTPQNHRPLTEVLHR